MDLRTPFNPLSVFLSDPNAAKTLAPIAALAIPPNTPPQLAQQIWEAAANQALQNARAGGVEVGFTVVNALIESSRAASEFRSEGHIAASRQPTGEIRLALTETRTGWKSVQIP
jgi:hypothetical protein